LIYSTFSKTISMTDDIRGLKGAFFISWYPPEWDWETGRSLVQNAKSWINNKET
jgi:hypothetical protein